MIKRIKIINTRGISEMVIIKNIYKNKPNIMVAPNGFGKTSIAKAFYNISNQTSIKTDDDDRYQQKISNKSLLEIEFDIGNGVNVLTATEDAHTNEIRKQFDIHVIFDLRRVKSTAQNFGAFLILMVR